MCFSRIKTHRLFQCKPYPGRRCQALHLLNLPHSNFLIVYTSVWTSQTILQPHFYPLATVKSTLGNILSASVSPRISNRCLNQHSKNSFPLLPSYNCNLSSYSDLETGLVHVGKSTHTAVTLKVV